MQNDETKGLGSHVLQNVKISRDESTWEVEIKAELPPEALAKYREGTLKDLQKTAKLDGFRPGNAPLNRIIEIYGEPAILKLAAEEAVRHELPELLAKEGTMIIEAPRVSIESPVADKPTALTARAPMPPEIKLPDYKAIAKKHPAPTPEEVTDAEHKEALSHLKRERARIDRIEKGSDPKRAHEESRALKDEELPELDDAFVQSLGIESAEKFTETLKDNIKNEKQLRSGEKRRAEIIEELVAGATVKYPQALREYELDEMEGRMKEDVERSGRNWEGFLTEAKKTPAELRESWKDAADKRAKVRLILAEIARTKKIEPDQKTLDHEFEHAKKHYQGAEPNALRAHISHIMRNEATLKFLESLS